MLARLAVLPILIAPGGEATASKVFRAVDEAASLRRTVRVMSIDDYYFNDGGELANRALQCGQDTTCIAQQLAPFNANLGLVVVINLEISPPLLSLILLDTEKTRVVAEKYEQVDGDVDAVFSRLRGATEEIFDERGFIQAGRLVVTADPPRASITVEGQTADRGTPNQFTLDAGTYEVRASATGFDDTSATAVVTGGLTTELGVQLVEQTPLYESPWFWAVGAVVVVGAIVGVGAATVSSRPDCYCLITADQQDCSLCQ